MRTNLKEQANEALIFAKWKEWRKARADRDFDVTKDYSFKVDFPINAEWMRLINANGGVFLVRSDEKGDRITEITFRGRTFDYQKLIIKYIAMVRSCEGRDCIDCAHNDTSDYPTPEEINELERLSIIASDLL